MIHLKDKILKEFNNLEKVVTKINNTLELIDKRDNDIYFDSLISALTLYLENFYMGVERIFVLIAKQIDQTTPSGKNWHLQLLSQMLIEIPSIRCTVISQQTYENLNEFRGFRHVARSLYAYDLEPKRVIDLADKINQCHENFKTDIEIFLNTL
ncbi:hypothetical protein [Crocosphaera sp.]|uniref:ribonuclease toxin HepT-like protein n=1 Tax=Crocosphaera sp. TaxID=2729996 RepID=UPI003F1F2C9F|nr:hypothetical protein [Crocosphaera sp.]